MEANSFWSAFVLSVFCLIILILYLLYNKVMKENSDKIYDGISQRRNTIIKVWETKEYEKWDR